MRKRKYIIESEYGGYTVQYPKGNDFEYVDMATSDQLGAEIKVWKTLRGAKNWIKKHNFDDNYRIIKKERW
uniref:Uncharacterized protein n=1 Tax=viral metagenome TaxID=1070528 RepID=A0A6H1ZDV1_9ZZZZ